MCLYIIAWALSRRQSFDWYLDGLAVIADDPEAHFNRMSATVDATEHALRTDGERVAFGFSYACEIKCAGTFVALDTEAQVDGAL